MSRYKALAKGLLAVLKKEAALPPAAGKGSGRNRESVSGRGWKEVQIGRKLFLPRRWKIC